MSEEKVYGLFLPVGDFQSKLVAIGNSRKLLRNMAKVMMDTRFGFSDEFGWENDWQFVHVRSPNRGKWGQVDMFISPISLSTPMAFMIGGS